jgi:hypothetical protein
MVGLGNTVVMPRPNAVLRTLALSPAALFARTDMRYWRYFSPHKFVGERIDVDGYRQSLCLLTEPAVKALHRPQHALLREDPCIRKAPHRFLTGRWHD